MLNVALLKIPVTDLSRAVSFYERALGVRAKFIVEAYGWAQLDGISVALALYVPGRGGGNSSPGGDAGFHLSHPRLDELLRGVRPVDPVAEIAVNDDGSRSLDLTDPDGNTLRIMERR